MAAQEIGEFHLGLHVKDVAKDDDQWGAIVVGYSLDTASSHQLNESGETVADRYPECEDTDLVVEVVEIGEDGYHAHSSQMTLHLNDRVEFEKRNAIKGIREHEESTITYKPESRLKARNDPYRPQGLPPENQYVGR